MTQKNKVQISFDTEYPNIYALEVYVQSLLEHHRISEHHDVKVIIDEAFNCHVKSDSIGSVTEIQIAWLKTECIEVVQKISKAHNRKKFDKAVRALFDNRNPDALSFCASIKRLLYQFRLSKAYEVREIIAEAYTRGVYKIDAGEPIHIPLAWMRTTCLNVIRDFKREQVKSSNPKFDGKAWSPGDVVFSDMVLREDLLSIQKAAEKLSSEEQKLLASRIFKRMTWQEIGEELPGKSGKSLKPGTARQRGSRALKKLREHYDAIRDDIRLPEEHVEPTTRWKTGWDWD